MYMFIRVMAKKYTVPIVPVFPGGPEVEERGRGGGAPKTFFGDQSFYTSVVCTGIRSKVFRVLFSVWMVGSGSGGGV